MVGPSHFHSGLTHPFDLGLDLSGRDSPRVAGIAREMALTSDHLIPRLNGENFSNILLWAIAYCSHPFHEQKPSGLSRLSSIIFLGAGTVLITYLIGKKMAGEKIGLMADSSWQPCRLLLPFTVVSW